MQISQRCAAADERVASAWRALEAVDDPEIPGLSIVDLGLVLSVAVDECGHLDVHLTPSYTGCPATQWIRAAVIGALDVADVGPFQVREILAPAWSSDWISAAGRRKLAALGIVPPEPATSGGTGVVDVRRAPACPHCHSVNTEQLSEFGATPCKSLHRCRACLEPFEQFKCI